MKNYYYHHLIKPLVKAKVKATDSTDEVLNKLKLKFGNSLNKTLVKFVSSYWKKEKFHFLKATSEFNSLFKMKGCDSQSLPLDNLNKSTHPGQLIDPAANKSIILRTPDDKYIMVDSDKTMYSACTRCNSRLFPMFNFCPFCGAQIKQVPTQPEPALQFPANPPSHVYEGKPVEYKKGGPLGRRIGLRKTQPINFPIVSKVKKQKDLNILVDIDDIKVFAADVENVAKDIDKYIPCKHK